MVRGVGDNDDTPPSGGKKKFGRARSEPGPTITSTKRDVIVHKHLPNPFGIPIVEDHDGLTPPPQQAPDPIEDAALKFDSRARDIVRRPGPTPTQTSIIGAISTQVIAQKIDDLKDTVTKELLEQLRKDRELERQTTASALVQREKWAALWRGLIWKLVAGAAVVFAILREYFAAKK